MGTLLDDLINAESILNRMLLLGGIDFYGLMTNLRGLCPVVHYRVESIGEKWNR
jgi:hypothetical protein